MSIAALETAWREATRPYEREHTTPFLWDQPERFATGNVLWETGRDLSRTHRVVVDYEEDYAVVRDGVRRALDRRAPASSASPRSRRFSTSTRRCAG